MDVIKFQSLFNQINKSSSRELKIDLYNSAVNYHRYRTGWYFGEIKERIMLDKSRTIAHDVFIDCCNIFSLNMAKI